MAITKKNRADLNTQASQAIFPNNQKKISAQSHQDYLKTVNESAVNRIDDIINDLTTGGTDKALSAEQGKVLAALIPGSGVLTNNFQNSDLDGNYEITINHAKNTNFVKPTLLDGNGVEQQTAGVFTVIDPDNVKFSLNAPIAGIWKYILQFF